MSQMSQMSHRIAAPTPAHASLIAERYTAVWSEPDPQLRRTAVADLWADDGAEFIEGVGFHGHDELEPRVAGAYQEFVAGGRYTVAHADDVAVHADVVTFTVQLRVNGGANAGEVAWAARVFLILDERGLIREDYHVTVVPLAAA